MSIFGISSSSKNGRRRAFIIVSLSPTDCAVVYFKTKSRGWKKRKAKTQQKLKFIIEIVEMSVM
jgi:hypothetical protein